MYAVSLLIWLLPAATALVGTPWRYNGTEAGQNYWQWYCAFPEDVAYQRHIPPLPEAVARVDPELRSLLMVTRHGARTPTDSHDTCWDGFDDLYWNCGATEGTASVVKYGLYADLDNGRDFTFYKSYGDPMVRNVLLGNCQKGQLLAEGAEQLSRIGAVIAAAYLNGTKLMTADQDGIYNAPLFTLDDYRSKGGLDFQSAVYMRSTDIQRTRLSALNLASSMLERMFDGALAKEQFTLPLLHVLDTEVDYLHAAKSKWTKRMHRTEEYRALIESHKVIAEEVIPNLKGSRVSQRWPWSDKLFDCMMTSACSEWSHPDQGRRVAPLFQDRPELIQDTYRALSEEWAFDATWHDAVVARFQAHTLVLSMRLSIIRTMCPKCATTKDLPLMVASVRAAGINTLHEPELQAALLLDMRPLQYVSAHDTTVKPLLAALGLFDNRVPAYASLLLFEVYAVPAEGYYGVRVVYNSIDITHRLDKCVEGRICNVAAFFKASAWAVDYSPTQAEEDAVHFEDAIHKPFSSRDRLGWFVTTTALLLLTAVISSSAALFIREYCMKTKPSDDADVQQAIVYHPNGPAIYSESQILLKAA